MNLIEKEKAPLFLCRRTHGEKCIEHIGKQRRRIRLETLVLKVEVQNVLRVIARRNNVVHLLEKTVRLATPARTHKHLCKVVARRLLNGKELKISIENLWYTELLKIKYFLLHQ